MTVVSKSELAAFLLREFPQTDIDIDEVGPHYALVRHRVTQASLRPGGTVSGPVMMATADAGVYVAILATVGLEALAVTTNLSINFLHRPEPGADILATCRLLKLGKVQVVGEVSMRSENSDRVVAHAVVTYARPPAGVQHIS